MPEDRDGGIVVHDWRMSRSKAVLTEGRLNVNVSLILVRSDGTSREFPVPSDRVTVGRQKECRLRIPVASVSRKHCELSIEGDRVLVRDLGSSNGTYVNRQRVQEQEVVAGDLIAVGPAVLLVRIDGQPEEYDATLLHDAGSPPAATESGAPVAHARPTSPNAPTQIGASPEGGGGGAQVGGDPDDSSVWDFDFDDDDDDQPTL